MPAAQASLTHFWVSLLFSFTEPLEVCLLNQELHQALQELQLHWIHAALLSLGYRSVLKSLLLYICSLLLPLYIHMYTPKPVACDHSYDRNGACGNALHIISAGKPVSGA